MSRPKLLIEQWLPIEAIGAECMRERGASSALPPLYFLHIWWARRPLTVSRAAILASLLPAYPTEEDLDARPFPDRFRVLFPTFESYKEWFLRLIGIYGDPVTAQKYLAWAKNRGLKVPNPYTHARAFTYNPSEEQLEQLYDLLEWSWGTREITFCDPMSGGGSIPFEALRYGLTVHANELNPVASMILKATLDYPARFGQSLVEAIKKYGRLWSERVQARLRPYFSDLDDDAIGACYLWARTVACPSTGKPVPLSPNWWIRKGSDPTAVRVIADPSESRCRFEIVRGATACKKADPDKGTVKRGTGISPWTGETIDGNYIKAEAQASRMGQQLYAVGIKKTRDFSFRPPTQADVEAVARAEQEAKKQFPRWQSKGLIPEEPRQEGRADWSCKIYGQKTWAHALSRRQLLANCVALEELIELTKQVDGASEKAKNDAVLVLLALAFDKAVNYNSTHCFWDYTRSKIAHAFSRHDFAFRFSFSEFDSSHNLFPWCIDQVEDAYRQIAKLATVPLKLFEAGVPNDSRTVTITKGAAQSLSAVPTQSLRSITVDPPYYDNVMYAECSNYFYVWLKRILGNRFPEIFDTELANEDDEAVMNAARFRSMGKRAKTLATADYENKMFACFKQ